MRQTGAQRLLLTHGGAFDDASVHLDQLMPNLDEVGSLALDAMLAGADDEAVTDQIQAFTESRIGAVIAEDPGIVQRYGWASPSFLSAMGFRRYLTKRGDLPTPPRP